MASNSLASPRRLAKALPGGRGWLTAPWLNETSYAVTIAFLLAVTIVTGAAVARHLPGADGVHVGLARLTHGASPGQRLALQAALAIGAVALSIANSATPEGWPRQGPPTLRWRRPHPALAGALVIALLAAPVAWSLGRAVSSPANGSPPAAAAEWLRSHHGGAVVRWAETQWYTHHPPKVGGLPPRGAIPASLASGGTGVPAVANHLAVPAALAPLATPGLPGEGEWHPAGRLVKGSPAVYEAFMRPDSVHTSLVAGIAWMDQTLLSAQLNSGNFIPGSGPWAHTAPVPAEKAATLVAALNGGFRMQDANGGYFSEGRTVVPLVGGAASVVIYGDGKATVAKWGRDAFMGPEVVAVRQNLELIVDDGRPVAGLDANDSRRWGITLGNRVFVWRSGLGVTSNGALLYVAGPGLNIITLADLLARAGAVRGMEMDINTDWVNLSTYNSEPASPGDGAPLLAGMSGGPARYFMPGWSRDFLTLSARPSPPSRALRF